MPFLICFHHIQLDLGTSLDKLNVIPNAVSRSSIRVEGPYTLFNVSWDPITKVNFGKVFYRIKMILNEEETIVSMYHYTYPRNLLFSTITSAKL